MVNPFIAQMMFWPGTFAPLGWSFCNGQLLAISSNNALFSLLGTIYGGDGRTTFALPDLRSRVPIGAGQGQGLSAYSIGAKGGQETVQLTQNEIPAHTHGISQLSAHLKASSAFGTRPIPDAPNSTLARLTIPRIQATLYSSGTPNISLRGAHVSGEVGNVGGGENHENRQPYLAINHVIALFGTFPSRT